MASLTVYSKPQCPQCTATYRALDKLDVDYDIVDLTADVVAFEMVRQLGYLQAPVIITTNGESWAGFRPDRIKAHAAATVQMLVAS